MRSGDHVSERSKKDNERQSGRRGRRPEQESTSVTANADGSWNSLIQYSAFGEIWQSNGVTPTDYRYTSQLSQVEVGLYYYNARWYDPALGRFVQADTIVPGVENPSAYDRYAYVAGNPINNTDSTGHFCDEEGNCYLRFGERLPNQTRDLNKINPIYYEVEKTKSFLPPVINPRVTGGYDYGANNGSSTGHIGQDYNPTSGNPDSFIIQASARGIVRSNVECTLTPCTGLGIAGEPNSENVSSAEDNHGYGNVLIVEYKYESLPLSVKKRIIYGYSIYMLYGHLAQPSPNTIVYPGEQIASIGNTGNSTGPHLHLAMYYGPPNRQFYNSESDYKWGAFNDLHPLNPNVFWDAIRNR